MGRYGRSGPPPKPTRLKLIAGNPGEKSLNLSEPQPRLIKSARPHEFLNDAGKGEWRRVTTELIALGLLSKIALGPLAGYCFQFQIFTEAAEKVKNGGMVRVVKGRVVPNPHIRIARDAGREMRMFAIEFGFTPASMSRISFSGGPDDDKEEREIFG